MNKTFKLENVYFDMFVKTKFDGKFVSDSRRLILNCETSERKRIVFEEN